MFKIMFSLNYFWTYIFAQFFSFMLRRTYTRFKGRSASYHALIGFLGILTALTNAIYLILGFWFMPEWWYPIVFVLQE